MRLATILVAACLTATGALAQTATPPRDPNMPDQRNTVPERIAPDAGSPGAGGNLSERLERSEGVITPPAGTDPAMRTVPPPNTSNTPVITPPGEAGGNPSVQPR